MLQLRFRAAPPQLNSGISQPHPKAWASNQVLSINHRATSNPAQVIYLFSFVACGFGVLSRVTLPSATWSFACSVQLLFVMMLFPHWISGDLCQNLTGTRRRYFWTVDSILWLVHIVVPHSWLLLLCSKFWIEKSKAKYVLIKVLTHLSSGVCEFWDQPLNFCSKTSWDSTRAFSDSADVIREYFHLNSIVSNMEYPSIHQDFYCT